MSVRSGSPVNEARMAARPDVAVTVRAGLIGGLIGGVSIWIYEAIVWVGVQHLMPLGGIPRNATGLVFGKAVQESLGPFAYTLGTGIHFFFASSGVCSSLSSGRISSGVVTRRPWSPCSLP